MTCDSVPEKGAWGPWLFEEAPNQAAIRGGCLGAVQDVYGRSKRCIYKGLPLDLTPWRILAEVPGGGGMVGRLRPVFRYLDSQLSAHVVLSKLIPSGLCAFGFG